MTARSTPSEVVARSSSSSEFPPGSLLGRLSASERSALLSAGTSREFAAGALLIQEGEESSHVFVLVDGMVKVTAATPDGHTTLLAIRVGGDIVGELAPIDHSRRSASVVAAIPTRVRIIAGNDFLRFLGNHPTASLEMMRVISGKLRSATNARVASGGYPVVARLAQVLLDLGESYGSPADDVVTIDIALSQVELAALVGSSGPAVHKALRGLRDKGAIKTGYRRIAICDWRALKAIADNTTAR